jgi:dTDP-4-dehydrorhamnose reductase
MSRYEFACLAARTFKFDSGLIEPVNTDALQQKAPRPLRAGMTIAKAAGALRTRLLAPAEGLRMMRDDPVSSI